MSFSNIIGRQAVKKRLLKAISSGTVSNSYIFFGQKGTGKKMLADEFIKALLCTAVGDDGACGVCPACKKVQSSNHPDLFILSAEETKKSIGINEIRELIESVYIKPFLADMKIFFIPDGDLLTAEAQNGLLKVLEEPPEYAVFIITVQKRSALLETVLSRSVCVFLSPQTEEETGKFFDAVLPERRLLCRSFSQGNIGRGKKMLEDEFFSLYTEAGEKLIRLLKDGSSLSEAISFFNENKDETNDILEFFMLLLRDALLFAYKLEDKIICIDKKSQISEIVQSYSLKEIIEKAEAIEEAKKSLADNAGYNITILKLLSRLSGPRQACGTGI